VPVSTHPEVSPPAGQDRAFLPGQPRKKSSSPVLLVLVLVALVGVGVARVAMQGKQDVPRVKVVAAAVDIPAGARLGYANLRYMDLPRPYWTPQMVSSTHLLAGRCARQYLSKAEPILTTQVLPAREGVSSLLAANERAVTLRLPEESMVEHALEPGDLVDVMFTASYKAKKYTRLICQRARVLLTMSRRAETSTRSNAGDASVITLAVSKGEAELISHAVESGKLKLVLRNRDDREELTPETIKDSSIFSWAPEVEDQGPAVGSPALLPAPPPPPPPAPQQAEQETGALPTRPVWSLEVFKGGNKEIVTFPLRGN